MLLGFFKVSGHSMLPKFSPDDIIIVSTLPYLFTSPKVGDVILFKKNGKNFLKRIRNIQEKKIAVQGDNKKDSLVVSDIEKKDIIGKILIKL